MYKDKFEKKTIFYIDGFDLNPIIQHQYHANFETLLDQQNGSMVGLDIDGNFTDYEEQDLNLYINTGDQNYNTLRLVMNDMCRRDLIEPGEYLISISW